MKFSQWLVLNHNQTILDDVIEVECRRRINRTYSVVEYSNLLMQIVDKLDFTSLETPETPEEQCKPMDVLLISYDSVSRSSWIRRATEATSYALDEMKFVLLNGYNIVGDGTPGKFKLIVI